MYVAQASAKSIITDAKPHLLYYGPFEATALSFMVIEGPRVPFRRRNCKSTLSSLPESRRVEPINSAAPIPDLLHEVLCSA
jgi:hypothetical protein